MHQAEAQIRPQQCGSGPGRHNRSMPDAPALHPAIASTAAWLDAAVIGLDLCPFAKAVRARHAVRFAFSAATDWPALRQDLASELAHLIAADPAAIETTLIVCPDLPAGFDDFNQFLDDADDTLVALDLEGVIQIASFHPDYRFAGTEADDVTNATNRSPLPTLHLLRESSVERAVASFGDTEAICDANLKTLRDLGNAGWERLRAAWLRSP